MGRIRSGLQKLLETYEIGGTRLVFDEIWLRVMRRSQVFDLFEQFLDPRFHEQLIMAPVLGYWPRLENPRSFNEKIGHRKLYSSEKIFTIVSGKYTVREYVSEHVGDDILNEVYLVTADPDQIEFEDLPDELVLKATHGQGMNEIIEEDDEINEEEVVDRCRGWLEESFGERQREYWYTAIEPKIIAERLLRNKDGSLPEDFKFYVFDGDVEYVHVDVDRFSDHKRRFYDADWNPQGFRRRYPLAEPEEPPDQFDEMITIAEQLGSDFDFARVDLYNVDDEGIVFGEITLAPGSGTARFMPPEVDFKLGELWTISE